MDSFTFDAVVIAAVLLLTVVSMGGWFAALIGEPTDERMYRASQTSPRSRTRLIVQRGRNRLAAGRHGSGDDRNAAEGA
jgi:hypothetical protein